MKIVIILALLAIAVYSGPTICNDCLTAFPNCKFQCLGKKCEAYNFNANCSALSPCYTSYYQTYSLDTMSATLCVACNYTIPNCMLCRASMCELCEPEYYLLGNMCFKLDGTPSGSLTYQESIWIAFVVVFGVLGIYFSVMKFLKFRKGQSSNQGFLS